MTVSFRPRLLAPGLALSLLAMAGLAAAAPAAAPAATTPAASPAAAPAPVVGPRDYAIDAVHSNVSFTVRHLVSKVSGDFRDFGGTLTIDPKNLATARGSFAAKTASIDTGNEKRDGHLKSPDFFDAEKWPEITFVITGVEPAGADGAKVKGDFTMRGVTKPVEFDVRDVAFVDMGGTGIMGFGGTTTINREDFGMTWNKVLDVGGVVLGQDVTIQLAIEAKAKPVLAPAAAAAGQ